jgi:hypothetical protein
VDAGPSLGSCSQPGQTRLYRSQFGTGSARRESSLNATGSPDDKDEGDRRSASTDCEEGKASLRGPQGNISPETSTLAIKAKRTRSGMSIAADTTKRSGVLRVLISSPPPQRVKPTANLGRNMSQLHTLTEEALSFAAKSLRAFSSTLVQPCSSPLG